MTPVSLRLGGLTGGLKFPKMNAMTSSRRERFVIRVGWASLALIFCSISVQAAPQKNIPAGKSYAASWRGKKSGGTGVGACSLIAPSWIMTAGHVASVKAKRPTTVVVTVKFGGQGNTRKVTRAWLVPEVDLAICKLDKPVTTIKPVAMPTLTIKKSHGRFPFTFVSKGQGALRVFNNRFATGTGTQIKHAKDANGQRPGKAGDSGGAWVFDMPPNTNDIMFGVIHGGGVGPQPAYKKAWINQKMAQFGTEKATWVALPNLKKLPRYFPYGKGCGAKLKMSNDIVQLPWIGEPFMAKLTGGPASSPALLALGSSKTAWKGIKLPFNIGPLGAPNCMVRCSQQILAPTTLTVNGARNIVITVPKNPALKGKSFHSQWLVMDPNINKLGLVTSNGVTMVVGG